MNKTRKKRYPYIIKERREKGKNKMITDNE